MSSPTSMFLHTGIHNATHHLEMAIPAYAAGKLAKSHHSHALGVLFRRRGVCQLLTSGRAEPLFLAQMQSVSAYLHRLRGMVDEEKVTSRAAVLWDAIGGEYWDAATEIAQHSRTLANPVWEHEDDFLYVWFLMTRYFRDDGSVQAEERQRGLLDRWASVLVGGYDPRHLLCDALLRRDAQGFHRAFGEVGDAREAKLRQQLDKGQLPEEDAAWVLPVWLEGLALLRLAERDGLQTDAYCRAVPQVMRGNNPYAYHADAWRRLQFQPSARG